MKLKSWLYLGVAAIVVVGGGSYFLFRGDKEEIKWRTAKIRRDSIRERVSATGTLSAILQVDVGTQVSGMVTSLSADFNSIVRKDQVIATIDPTTYAQRVQMEEISLEQRRLTLADAESQYERYKNLAQHNLVSVQELEARELSFRNAKTQYDNSVISLEQAKTNLGYCTIKSPVDGVVVSRKADVGQTLAASMTTPNLFVIAEDLNKMKLEISIDEADISNVRVGQVANFTVDAFGDKQFRGAVSQVRLEPVTVQNVVSYRVVVEVNNMTREELEAQNQRNQAMRFGGGPGGVPGGGPGSGGPGAPGGAPGTPGADSGAVAPQAEGQRPGAGQGQRPGEGQVQRSGEGQRPQAGPGGSGERRQGQGGQGGQGGGGRPLLADGSVDYDAQWERVKDRVLAARPGTTKEAWIQQMKQMEQQGGDRAGRGGQGGQGGRPGGGFGSGPGSNPGSDGARPMSGQQVAQPATTSSIIKSGGPFYQGEFVLRPGMTANVTIITNQRDGVLGVPATALRFNPANFDPSLAEELGVQPQPQQQQQQAFGPPRAPTPQDRRARLMDRGLASRRDDKVWVLDENGKPKAVSVVVGLADPQLTEVSGEGLSEGLDVIVGVDESNKKTSTPASGANPFQMGGPGMRR